MHRHVPPQVIARELHDRVHVPFGPPQAAPYCNAEKRLAVVELHALTSQVVVYPALNDTIQSLCPIMLSA